jgi:hypothetical protein
MEVTAQTFTFFLTGVKQSGVCILQVRQGSCAVKRRRRMDGEAARYLAVAASEFGLTASS